MRVAEQLATLTVFEPAAGLPADVGGVAAQGEMPNRTSFSEVPAARVQRFGDSRRVEAAKLVGTSINGSKFMKGAIDMGLALELSLAEAVKPLTAFRYISLDAVGTMIDFENAIEDGLAVMAVEAGQLGKPDYRFRSLIGLANAVDAAS
jgi:hypothetical protein